MNIIKKLGYYIKSLKFRIGITIFLLLSISSMCALYAYSVSFEDRELNSYTASVISQAQLISSQIQTKGYLSMDSNEGETVGVSAFLYKDFKAFNEMFAGRIMIIDSSMTILTDTYNIYNGKTLIWENAMRSLKGEVVSEYDNINNLLTVTIPIETQLSTEESTVQGVVMITKNIDHISQNKMFYSELRSIIAGVIIVFSIFISVIFGYFLTNPIRSFGSEVQRLTEGSITKLGSSKIQEIDFIAEEINIYANKQAKMDVSVKDFLSNVSHELKTPLTSMKILADSLNASENTPMEFYKEFMEDMANEIDRETAVINDLIGMVRTENYISKLEFVRVNINDFTESIMKMLRPMAESRNIELLLETFSPIYVMADEVKFSQVLINIIENAIKYNRDGGHVHVSIKAFEDNCFIRIEDNGMGIPKENLERIFDRFYRVDTSHSKDVEGTGLGLYIVKEIVVQHGGRIKADSIEGQGSVFTICIPLDYKNEKD